MSSLRVLPAIQTVAALQPHILTVELPTYEEVDVRAALAGGSNSRPLELVSHELCHWFDMVGTSWGQEYLGILFRALDDALLFPPDISAYQSAIALFDADRSVLFPTYYKYVKRDAPRDTGSGRWRMEITSGSRVDTFGVPQESDPILFVHFSTRDKDIGRQPISIGSLMELRAIFSELAAYRFVSGQWSPEERVVGDSLFNRRVVESMYDPSLITYSAAAHYVGRTLNQGDIVDALGLGSVIADFCLNLTAESYAVMRDAPQMIPWGAAKLNGFRRNRDRGFAFGNLTFHAAGSGNLPAYGKVAAVLLSSGLGSFDAIYGPSEDYIRSLNVEDIRDPRLREIRQKTLEAGRVVAAFRRLKAGVFQVSDWANLPVPPVLDRNMSPFYLGVPALSFDDVEYLHKCDWLLNEYTRQALRASRGLDFAYTDWVY